MELDILTQALRLRDRGLSIFPVSTETKRPVIAWDRLQDTLPTYAEVKEWFSVPKRAVGVACGPVSNLFLLDFDFAKHPSSKQFYESHTFPRTWKEKTTSGGLHLYFKWSDALNLKQTNTVSKIALGVDSRGYGGYSKVCPSPGYEWLLAPHLTPLADLPLWLINALPNKDRREIAEAFHQKPDDWMVRELDHIDPSNPINGRTPTFVRAINRLKAKGLSALEIKTLLAVYAQKYSYPKLDSLVDDQFQRYPQRQNIEPKVESQAESVETFLANQTPVRWICHPFIAEQTIGFIAGLPEARKTFALFDLAIESARGGLWMGKFPIRQCKVLVVDQERAKSETQRRFQGMIKEKGLSLTSLNQTLFLRCGTTTRIDLQASYDAFRKIVSDTRPDLILIDSFATFHTKNDGNRYEIQPVMERIKELRNEFQCSIIFVHHETKQSYQNKKEGAESSYLDMAGNVAIPAAAEFCMNVTKYDAESSFCHHTKSTLGIKAAPFLIRVEDTLNGGIRVVAL